VNLSAVSLPRSRSGRALAPVMASVDAQRPRVALIGKVSSIRRHYDSNIQLADAGELPQTIPGISIRAQSPQRLHASKRRGGDGDETSATTLSLANGD